MSLIHHPGDAFAAKLLRQPRPIPIRPINPIIPQDIADPEAAVAPFPTADIPQIEIAKFPVWLYPSADSQAFDYVKYVALPGAPFPSTAVIVDFFVPAGMNGIIKRFGNAYVGAGFTEGSGALFWQLLADGQPIPNYENIPASLGATANPSEVSSIRIKENQHIQLTVTNLSLAVGGAFSGGRFGGWFYPSDQEPTGTWAAG